MNTRSGLRRRTRKARAALLVALLWGTALVVAAFTAPMYSGESGSATSTVDASGVPSTTVEVATHHTATLVEVNGLRGAVFASPPLATLVVAVLALWGPPSEAGHVAAWVVAGLLSGVNVLSMLSVGIFLVPLTAALFLAIGSATSQPRPPSPV